MCRYVANFSYEIFAKFSQFKKNPGLSIQKERNRDNEHVLSSYIQRNGVYNSFKI